MISFGIFFKVVQDCLPSETLQINGVRGFCLKGFDNFGFIIQRKKLHPHYPAITQQTFNQLVDNNFLINTIKIKTKTPVFGFHP